MPKLKECVFPPLSIALPVNRDAGISRSEVRIGRPKPRPSFLKTGGLVTLEKMNRGH
jgi:hypothetical protein